MGTYNMGYTNNNTLLNTPLMGTYNMGYTNNNTLLNTPLRVHTIWAIIIDKRITHNV